MQEEKDFKESWGKEFQRPEKVREEIFEKEKESSFEREEKEGLKETEIEKRYPEKRFTPSVEEIKSSLSSNTSPPRPNLLEEDEKLVNFLVSLVIKNPDTEKGLEEANRILNEEAKRRNIREHSELAYLIDAFHDELVRKLREREQKFNIDK